MSTFNTVDYLTNAIARETSPFIGDISFENILTLLLQEPSQLQEALGNIKQTSSIDDAYGESLDVIGLIVGQERSLPANAADIGLLTYFGFDGSENSLGFGDLDNANTGANFIDQNQLDGGVITLSDEAYRFFIRAKIIANTTSATPNEIISATSFLFGIEEVSYYERSANITIGLGISPDQTTSLAGTGLDIKAVAYAFIPKPAGVNIAFIYNYDPANVFGFEGDIGSLGFGDLDDSEVGGSFAEIF